MYKQNPERLSIILAESLMSPMYLAIKTGKITSINNILVLVEIETEIASWFNQSVDEFKAMFQFYVAITRDVASRLFERKLNASTRVLESLNTSA